jgi:hypothetical protein
MVVLAVARRKISKRPEGTWMRKIGRLAPIVLLLNAGFFSSVAQAQNQTIAISSYSVQSGNCLFMDDGNDGTSGGALQVYPPYVANEPTQVFNWLESGSSVNWYIQNSTSKLYLYDTGTAIDTETQQGDLFTIKATNSSGTQGYILDVTTGRYLEQPSNNAGATIPTGPTPYVWYFSLNGSSSSSPGCGSTGGVTTIDDTDSSILYSLPDGATGAGGWASGSGISGDYDGTEHSSNYQSQSPSGLGGTFRGVSASVNFNGTGITWIGKKGPNYGVATYAIDGGTPTTFNAYASTEIDQNPNVSVTGLASGSHVLTISLTNSTSGSNYYQTIDAFQITGSPLYLSNGTVLSPCTSPSLLSYAYGSWAGACNQSGGDGSDGPAPAGHIYSGSSSSYIQWTFTGSLIEIIGRPDFEDGGISVSIDGGAAQTFSMQAGNADVDAYNYMVVFAKKLSTSGTHTIRISPTGSGAGNSDEYIQIVELIAFQ